MTPFLACFLVAFLTCEPHRSEGMAGTSARPVSEHVPRPGAVAFSHSEEVEDLIFQATNEQRGERGLPQLQLEETLAAIAREHSDDMVAHGFFRHDNPDGQSPADRVSFGHRRLIGLVSENIWSGSGYTTESRDQLRQLADLVMTGWMKSPGHRKNILRPDSTHLGVGVSVQGSEIRATQKFANVLAYTRHPLPLRIPSGAVLDLSATPVSNPTAPTMYDLWLSQRERRAAGPFPIEAGTIEARQGRYSLRFFFPMAGGNRYEIYPGPVVEVD